ncbi:diaminopimelate epimerase [Dehalococcoidia bacterium]|nr:diaminopimelate epimerase [Dehalococcoidia bacterium]
MKFKKYHGAGNDYVYVDARAERRDWHSLARAMSDRHTGVGGDGLIILLPSDIADMRMRIFNADGSEAEMCGNGIRCFVRFALEEITRGTTVADIVNVETAVGVLAVTPIWEDGHMTRASVDMGAPQLQPAEIPLALKGDGPVMDHVLTVGNDSVKITGVSMGNPHAVVFLQQGVAEYPLDRVGPQVEVHPLFPNRVNFEIVNVLGRERLKVRVWERGSGLTQACGTGACAVVVAARLHGLVDDQVDVDLPGGTLRVRWPGQGTVILEGPIAEVFEGAWPD